jgi:non-ribosomal peptide synthetase component F
MPPEPLIGLYLERSFEMVISILAVLKSGGAYVPIVPEYPKTRVSWILTDSDVPLIVTQQPHRVTLQQWTTQTVKPASLLCADDRQLYRGVDNCDLNHLTGVTNLAYVIYTSGTTGKPKGVMIEHASVSNLTQFIAKTHQLNDSTRALLFSNYVFDALVFELFPVLLSGGRLYIVLSQITQGGDWLYIGSIAG